MLSGSRSGWCELHGEPTDIDALLHSLGAREAPVETGFGEPCPMLYRFAEARSLAGWQPREGVRRFEHDGPPPSNPDEVRLRWIYVEPTGRTACLSLELPDG